MIKFIKEKFLVLAVATPLLTTSAHANIYVTDLKLNGVQFLDIGAGFSAINITYVLNEPATLGVTINIASGTNLVRTLAPAAGTPGALFGYNLVSWDGNGSDGFPAPSGQYIISVTAASDGHTNWTQISQDTNAGNYVYDPRGLAVNNNSNSPYYGRVFVGNAGTGPNYTTVPGDQDTILKLNADGTFADEGPDGNGGYDIFDDGNSDLPQKMRVAEDDRLYMMDLSGYAAVAAFDMLLSTNEVVLDSDNYTGNPFWFSSLSGALVGWFSMDVTDANTTNGLIWLGQWDADGAGIWNWHLTNGVANPNDQSGHWAVAVGGSLGVAASGGVMVDTNYDIFVGQYLTDAGDTNADCMVFTNWNHGLSYDGQAVSNGAAWSAGGNDTNFLGVYDTTIDSRQRPNYVACALNGGPVGGIQILNATNGTLVTNLDATNQYYVTAWDNVGNLYAASGTSHRLRVFSPPVGTNQAAANASVKIESAITSIKLNGTTLTIQFLASRGDSASQFSLQSCATVNGTFQTIPSAVPTLISPGFFTVSTPVTAPVQFYRISSIGQP
jgi:FlgD Ig-like domain